MSLKTRGMEKAKDDKHKVALFIHIFGEEAREVYNSTHAGQTTIVKPFVLISSTETNKNGSLLIIISHNCNL